MIKRPVDAGLFHVLQEWSAQQSGPFW
jgi:hypothetical protein